jgi:hypothetical protein
MASVWVPLAHGEQLVDVVGQVAKPQAGFIARHSIMTTIVGPVCSVVNSAAGRFSSLLRIRSAASRISERTEPFASSG